MGFLDKLLEEVDQGIRVLTTGVEPSRPVPGSDKDDVLTDAEKEASTRLMRVNHTGEVCAQALYSGQALVERDPRIRSELVHSAAEELDHLSWTERRIKELGGRASLLNPIFFVGSFSLGLIAGVTGTKNSLGFLVETERQVENHLTGHLQQLPERDLRSRAIVTKMREDEQNHGMRARDLGASDLPEAIKLGMRYFSKLMTKSTYYL
jgi:ubiquinone biosynthesis monooxygenase Coq7